MDSDCPSHSLNIIFICMGNICRSPMAEFLLKDMVKKAKIDNLFNISSAAVLDENVGKPVCDGTQKELKKHNIPYTNRVSKRLTKELCDEADYIICMDDAIGNLAISIGGEEVKNKLHKLLDYSDEPMDIVDPAETNDFERTYREVSKGCFAFFKYLMSAEHIRTHNLKRVV